MDRRILVVAALALCSCSSRLDTKKLDPLRAVEPFCQTLFGEFISVMGDCTGWTQQLEDHEYERALGLCAGFAWSESQGRIGYDRARAQSCLSAMRDSSCTLDRVRAMDDCQLAIPGKRPNGADCYDDAECADPEARCTVPLPQCPGRCSAPGHLDEPCGPGYRPCARGYYCGPASTCLAALAEGDLACLAALNACGDPGLAECSSAAGCVRYALEGERCDAARQCVKGDDKAGALFCDTLNSSPPVCRRYGTVPRDGLCNSGDWCDPAGWCYVSGTPPGTCIARLGAGLACLGDSMCAPPLACIGDTYDSGTNTYTFGACGPRVAMGATCNPSSLDCQLGAACIQSGISFTCQPWPSQLDAPCGLNPGDQVCYVGRCDPAAAPVCRPWLPAGSACNTDSDCGPFGGIGAPRCDTTASGFRQCIPGCMDR